MNTALSPLDVELLRAVELRARRPLPLVERLLGPILGGGYVLTPLGRMTLEASDVPATLVAR